MTDAFFDRPPPLQINAWTGHDTAPAALATARMAWALQRHSAGEAADEAERAPGIVNDWDWQAREVGWGLVLPHDDTIEPAARRATAADAPAAIQRLVAARGNAPVLRWRADGAGAGELLRYDANGREWPLRLTSGMGIAPWQVPRFLLIFAPPDRVPWSFQYAANLGRYVGRLWLEGEALDRYVDALISDWAGAACDTGAPLVWSVDHGEPDITWLMDRAISRKLSEAWRTDKDDDFARATRLFGADATQGRLVDALAATRPGLVVTTSHGMTGPLHDAAALRAQLGVPVDAAHRALDLAALTGRWQPDGAIWYAHACCSAGSDAVSAYDGLFDPASEVGRVLAGVAAACGARIAPLPHKLLGAERPLRAFIGHVEPTFNWSLRDRDTNQPLTHSLLDALHHKLFEGGQRRPIGWAMARVFDSVGTLLDDWRLECAAEQHGRPGSLQRALYCQVAALDRQHTVILGDPAVALQGVG
jgi:hypothetical protein